MLWLTSKRTDNAKRLLQRYLNPLSKHFSISCQQTKSFKHILRYILKEPLVLGVCHSEHLAKYCYSLCNEDIVYKKGPVETSDNKMITALLKIMKDKNCYSTEELMKSSPDIMVNYLHKSNLESIVQNCKLFLLKPNDSKMLLERLTKDAIPGSSWFKIYAYLMCQDINPLNFVCDFINIFCKFPDKRNVFTVQGPSNTGKTSFFRPLLELVQFGEVVSGGQFMFQNCINKELLIWEEPLIGSDFVEMCKRVFEGMTTQVPVKFKAPQTLYRTPIIITSNKDIWHYCDSDEMALRNRMILYHFNHDANEIQNRGASWWRSTYECYCRDCEFIGEYVTGIDPKYPTSSEPSGTTTDSQPSTECQQLHTDREPDSPGCEQLDPGATQHIVG